MLHLENTLKVPFLCSVCPGRWGGACRVWGFCAGSSGRRDAPQALCSGLDSVWAQEGGVEDLFMFLDKTQQKPKKEEVGSFYELFIPPHA